MAGWKQFAADVAAYTPGAVEAPAATGRAPDQLPSLHISVTGMVTASNPTEFKAQALAVLGGINRDLQTDEDFANAEPTVTWAKGVEDRLEATKKHVLSQTADIDAVFRTIDEVSAEKRHIRLELDRLVKAEKENRKGEIVQAGARGVRGHYDAINATLGEHRFQPPQTVMLDLGNAIKGKRSLASMRDAVHSMAAQHKVAASQSAERVRANVAILAKHADHAPLFADRVQLCASKTPEDLRNLVAARIADYQQREADRLEAEREKIRAEETARIQREADDARAAGAGGGRPATCRGGQRRGGTADCRDAGAGRGRRIPGAHLDHAAHRPQVLPEQISRALSEARDAAEIKGEHPPTFHEIRSLGGARLINEAGWTKEQVQALMDHAEVAMTTAYLDCHEMPWIEVATGLPISR